jgi:hypothetical protein
MKLDKCLDFEFFIEEQGDLVRNFLKSNVREITIQKSTNNSFSDNDLGHKINLKNALSEKLSSKSHIVIKNIQEYNLKCKINNKVCDMIKKHILREGKKINFQFKDRYITVSIEPSLLFETDLLLQNKSNIEIELNKLKKYLTRKTKLNEIKIPGNLIVLVEIKSYFDFASILDQIIS